MPSHREEMPWQRDAENARTIGRAPLSAVIVIWTEGFFDGDDERWP